MTPIRCDARLFTIGSWTILRLPQSASAKLPSRGMAMVEGTINGSRFRTVLEPDGRGSHWFRADTTMSKAAKADAGDTVTLAMEPTKEWPEPTVPADVKKALAAVPKVQNMWVDITPMARWDWIRWIGSTAQPETRKRRIEVACSKLKAGERRPCCFNRSMCCEPSVSKNGVLLEPQMQMGTFDRKTSSWVKTPSEIRKLGGAIFCDRRYDHVFVYHNGAESYYAARGFRGSLRV